MIQNTIQTCNEERVMSTDGRVDDVLAFESGHRLGHVAGDGVAETKLAARVATWNVKLLCYIYIYMCQNCICIAF